MKSLASCMEAAGVSFEALVRSTGLDKKVVRAIVAGNYTPSPAQRERLAEAVGLSKDDIAWGHIIEVQHLRGNGPQFGRST